jgi:hypothetical protein
MLGRWFIRTTLRDEKTLLPDSITPGITERGENLQEGTGQRVRFFPTDTGGHVPEVTLVKIDSLYRMAQK